MKTIFILVLILCCFNSFGQLRGFVFRDYNGNGTLDTASSSTASAYYEIGVPNVTVKAYNSSDVLAASTTTNATGNYSFATLALPAGTNVRLEFTIPSTATRCLSKLIDFTSVQGTASANSLSSVQFVTAGASAVANYGINNPEDYNTNLNPTVYVPQYRNGDPLRTTPPFAGAIIPQDSSAFLSFPYNSAGVTNANTILAPAKNIGSTWGVAYSKQSNSVFTSAILKRHTGLGRGTGNFLSAPGAIYRIRPGVDNGTFFTTLDSTLWGSTYYTHNRLTTSDALHVQSNTTRGLSDVYGKINDARVFDQIGKVGIGGLEISDDGRYLYAVNMYDKSIVRIDIQNTTTPIAPTATTHFTRYALPTVTTIADATDASRGTLRPWALKFYRGKLYIGAVMDASTSGTASHLKAYVIEFDTATASFTTILNSPLTYPRSTPFITGTCATRAGWYAWTAVFNTCNFNGTRDITNVYPQPMLTDIDFDNEGAMIITFSDRNGYQGGVGQYGITGTNIFDSYVNGDILRAFRKTDCTFELETNAKEGASSAKPATSGLANLQGPTNGEFYVGDGDTDNSSIAFDFHPDNSGGSLAYVPGLNNILNTFVDPINAGTNGTAKLHNTRGTILAGNSYQTYNTANNIGTHHKIHGLGDMEILKPEATIEVGNRVWNDTDYDGVQEPGEVGISGVELTLFTDPNGDGNPTDGVSIGVATTDANGNYIFSSATGTTTSSRRFGLGIQPNTNYIIRITNATIDTLGNLSTDFITGDSYGTIKTLSNYTGNGEPDWSDNDGVIFYINPNTYANYQLRFATGRKGENNHTYDIGLATSFFILSNKYINLQGFVQNNNAHLKWTTESTNNVLQYEIERSTDGITFKKYQIITNINTLTAINQMDDDKLFFYYRVKLIEADGRSIYSNILRLQKDNYETIKLVGNPVLQQMAVDVNTTYNNTQLTLTLYSYNGAIVWSTVAKCQKGMQQLKYTLPHLQSGLYTLKAVSQYTVQAQKVMIK